MSNQPSQQRVSIPGSERPPMRAAQQVGPVDLKERVEVSVYLRPRSNEGLTDAMNGQLLQQRHVLTREEYAASYGADPEDMAKVEAFAHNHDLTIVEADSTRRVVILAGAAAAMQAAFGVNLYHYEHPSGAYRGHTGSVQIPSELSNIVQAVLGLDDRRQLHSKLQPSKPSIGAPEVSPISYTPLQLAKHYNFPADSNGSGECIAILEFGDGGYRSKDLEAYFQHLGIPSPKVTSISVDGEHNAPTGDPKSGDAEVTLDIEVVGAVVPGASIVVYFAPATDRGFVDAVTKAIHDTKYKPSVISISFGGPECFWTSQAIRVANQALQAAAIVGVTVCCAAGDHGAGGGVGDNLAHVAFPASSPYVLSCGGTRLEAAGTPTSIETVWNADAGWATGGGVSDLFDVPIWQSGAHVPTSINPGGHVGRGIPDVAANADLQTGYQIFVDGQSAVNGGTSAVAPLWAALLVLINQQLGQPVGYFNPILYQQIASANVLREVTIGHNNGYQAGPGWNACTGLGTPDGMNLLNTLSTLIGHKSRPATPGS